MCGAHGPFILSLGCDFSTLGFGHGKSNFFPFVGHFFPVSGRGPFSIFDQIFPFSAFGPFSILYQAA